MTETVLKTELAGESTEHDATEPSVRVVNEVAAATDADPLSMAPLYETIDPDALDQLVAAEIDGYVHFTYAGHEVTVHGDGAVVVDGRTAEADAADAEDDR